MSKYIKNIQNIVQLLDYQGTLDIRSILSI